jgi:ABC-2 type transport system ATP-binding protein
MVPLDSASVSTAAAAPRAPLLAARDLSFRFPRWRPRRGRRGDARSPVHSPDGDAAPASDRPALDQVSISIAPGEALALLGANGSGKSTLLRILAGTLSPGGGTLSVAGDPSETERRRMLGVVFQSPALDPLLTIRENLHLQGRLFGIERAELRSRIESLLDRFELAERGDQPVRTLSGGLARRADLARAVLHEPRLLLLDEPTTGLDPLARERFLGLLMEWRSARGLAILLCTHLIDEADRCERVVLLHEGRVLADGPPTLLRRAMGPRVVTVAADAALPPALDGLPWRDAGGRRLLAVDGAAVGRSTLEDGIERTVALLASAEVPFTLAPPTLADVLAALSQRHPATVDAERTA